MSDIHEIEVSMAEVRSTIEMGDKLERLLKNQDFRDLIMVGYLQTEAIRLVMTKTKQGMESADKQAAVIRSIDGIGEFNKYLHRVDLAADQALATLEQLQEAQAEIEQEVQ